MDDKSLAKSSKNEVTINDININPNEKKNLFGSGFGAIKGLNFVFPNSKIDSNMHLLNNNYFNDSKI